MTAVKIAGVVIGALLLLGLGFIEPTKNMQDTGLRGLIIMVGLAVSAGLAIAGIQYVRRQKEEVEHDDY